MKALRFVSVGACGLLSLALLAAEPAEAAKAKKGADFAKLDADGDGKISLKEFEASGKGKGKDKIFNKLDTNKDGFLTKDELANLKKKKKNN